MIENMCAEVLLTGLLWINNKSLDKDTNTNIYYEYSKSTTYVVPDKYSLITNNCGKEVFNKKISHKDMRYFLTTLK